EIRIAAIEEHHRVEDQPAIAAVEHPEIAIEPVFHETLVDELIERRDARAYRHAHRGEVHVPAGAAIPVDDPEREESRVDAGPAGPRLATPPALHVELRAGNSLERGADRREAQVDARIARIEDVEVDAPDPLVALCQLFLEQVHREHAGPAVQVGARLALEARIVDDP